MRFADFILENMESILVEWEEFAGTMLPAAESMTPLALRDHAKQILEAVAKDLTTSQTRKAQSEKSKGRAPILAEAPETAAETHAILRARSGFDINQLVAEYRALRASVLQMWLDTDPRSELRDVTRFNEAIDQAIAESVRHFHEQQERSRNLLLGMLGHDMRTPLNSIVLTASYLAALNAGDEVSAAAEHLIRSGSSIRELLDDLVDFNRTKLGLGVKVDRSDIDLAAEVAAEVQQLRAAHPDRRIDLAVTGDTRGWWDGARLQQVLRNLVSNAISYGSSDTPVHVALRGEEAEVWLAVTNTGSAIDPSALSQIFDPLQRSSPEQYSSDSRDGLGLGLFIVREILNAHGGDVEVCCGGGETAFVVRLPRYPASGDSGQ